MRFDVSVTAKGAQLLQGLPPSRQLQPAPGVQQPGRAADVMALPLSSTLRMRSKQRL